MRVEIFTGRELTGAERRQRKGMYGDHATVWGVVVGNKAEMPDADKALREHVQKEPANEFFGVDGHRALHVSMSVIPPAERDVVAVKGEQSMIGDGDAMRVTAKIAKYLFGTAEGRF